MLMSGALVLRRQSCWLSPLLVLLATTGLAQRSLLARALAIWRRACVLLWLVAAMVAGVAGVVLWLR
jgi:hypothetical protein